MPKVKRTNRGFAVYAEINERRRNGSLRPYATLRLQASSRATGVPRAWLFQSGDEITDAPHQEPRCASLGFELSPSEARRLRDGINAFLLDVHTEPAEPTED